VIGHVTISADTAASTLAPHECHSTAVCENCIIAYQSFLPLWIPGTARTLPLRYLKTPTEHFGRIAEEKRIRSPSSAPPRSRIFTELTTAEGAVRQSAPDASEFLNTSGAMRLVKAFSRIRRLVAKRAFVEICELFARELNQGAARRSH
jgi:hypothetical protein